MKKILALILIVLLLMSTLSACSAFSSLEDAMDGIFSRDTDRDEDDDDDDDDWKDKDDSEDKEESALDSLLPESPTATAEDSADHELTLSQYSMTLSVGESVTLIATSGNGGWQWSSSNESIVLVNSKGLVTGARVGAANVTCTDKAGKSASCTVTVVAAAEQPSASDAGFIFPHSSSAYLTEAEITATFAAMTTPSLASSYAQDAINEIYARHGYPFKSAKISAYYSGQSWYTANPNFSMSSLNKYESHNAALLQKFK